MDYLKNKALDISVHATQMFIWVSLRTAILIFGKLEVKGLENLKGIKGPVIFAPNHSSHIDPPLLGTALPFYSRFFPIYFVTLPFKEYTNISTSLFTKVLYSITPFALTGSVPIEPGVKNYKVSLRKHIDLLKRGRSVCIFPEGRVTLNGKIGEAHGGVAYLSAVTSVPVLPVKFVGTYNITLKSFFTQRPVLSVKFYPPIQSLKSQDKLTGLDYKKGAAKILDVIKSDL